MAGPIAEVLASLLPESSIVVGDECRDWSVSGRVPQAVVSPGSVQEGSELMAASTREGWRVVPAGAGSWLGAGGVPDGVDIVLSTGALNSIVEYEPADLTVTVEAGVTLGAISRVCGAEGQWLPLDPAGGEGGTLGATLATASYGPLHAAYGVPRDHLLGVTVVAGDGRVLSFGGKVVKNVAGFDLGKLMVGSWGTLGVITSATFRLHPVPQRDATIVLSGASRESLVDAARTLATGALPISALELVEPGRAVLAKGGSESALVVRVLGAAPPVEETVDSVRGLFPGIEFECLEGEEPASVHAAFSSFEEGAALVARLSLLPSQLSEALSLGGELISGTAGGSSGGDSGAGARMAAHVATGVMRIVLPSVGEDEAVATALGRVRTEVGERSGSLRIIQASPDVLERVGPWGDPGGARRLMMGIKEVFDPDNTLSPGRFVV
jgi:glycolate oxidase FAD binding subunit